MDCVLLLLLLSLCLVPTSSQSTSVLSSVLESDVCPERLLGNERKRTCPKNCKQDKDCGNKRQCLCDGQCGLSCVAPGRHCPWPITPGENWVARLLSPSPSFSALLEVRCDLGFTLPSGLDAAIRRCQGDRQWSGDEPICIGAQATVPPTALSALSAPSARSAPPAPLVDCPLPEDNFSALQIIIQGNGTGSISYSCLPGYDLVGSSENICLDNQTWQYPHPICQRVFCLPPREVEMGYVVAVAKPEYEVGFDIHYLCKKNFLLDGPNMVTCQSNGNWSDSPPYCRARCLIPAERSRIMIGGEKRWPYDVTDAMVPHGENVTFYCKHPRKQCSFPAAQACFDGKLTQPSCYTEPTWLQYKLFPHRLVSEIEACEPGDLM